MPIFLIYVETLNPENWKIERSSEPVGWIRSRHVAFAHSFARIKFSLRANQCPHCIAYPGYLIRRVEKRQDTAAKKGRNASFIFHYRAMLAAIRERRPKPSAQRDGMAGTIGTAR